MSDKLVTRNGETVEIDSIIEALEATPDKGEILEALKGLRADKVKAALGETVRAVQFNRSETFEDFIIDGEKSEATQRTYRREVKRLFEYLDRLGVHVLQANHKTVDDFSKYLLNMGLSANTRRLTLAACSAYYTYLKKLEYLERSPFTHIKYPAKEYKKAVRPDHGSPVPVMNDAEYEAILEALERKAVERGKRVSVVNSRNSARRILPLVHFMATYGLRIGDALTVRLEGEYFSVRAKGDKVRSFELKPETQEILKRMGMERRELFDGIGTSTVQNAITKITGKLSGDGVIRHKYTCHDFRHYFAVNLYRETRDIYAVKEALGHATVSITEVYLAGMGAS